MPSHCPSQPQRILLGSAIFYPVCCPRPSSLRPVWPAVAVLRETGSGRSPSTLSIPASTQPRNPTPQPPQPKVFQRNAGNGLLETEELVDVHFSERGRQGRLVVMAMEARQRYAFGADEDTAYVWTPGGGGGGGYEVIGAGGVVVYYETQGSRTGQKTTMHYLTAGDRIDVATGRISFSPDKTICDDGEVPASSASIFSGTNYRRISIAMAKYVRIELRDMLLTSLSVDLPWVALRVCAGMEHAAPFFLGGSQLTAGRRFHARTLLP